MVLLCWITSKASVFSPSIFPVKSSHSRFAGIEDFSHQFLEQGRYNSKGIGSPAKEGRNICYKAEMKVDVFTSAGKQFKKPAAFRFLLQLKKSSTFCLATVANSWHSNLTLCYLAFLHPSTSMFLPFFTAATTLSLAWLIDGGSLSMNSGGRHSFLSRISTISHLFLYVAAEKSLNNRKEGKRRE